MRKDIQNMLIVASLQTFHAYFMLKWRGNERFHVVSTWNARGVFVGLHVNFWIFWWMLFCFMMKKDHFKQKLLLWPKVHFKLNTIKIFCRKNLTPILNCSIKTLICRNYCQNFIQFWGKLSSKFDKLPYTFFYNK